MAPVPKKATPSTPGGWHVRFEPELHLGEDVVVSDVAGLDGGRWIVTANHADKTYACVEPFAAVELDLARGWIESA
jgi:hypothetical protein